MNLVIGIETSGRSGSVAILTGRGAESDSFSEGVVHGVGLAPALSRVLARAGAAVAAADLVAVGLGPGSYTGVRVGVSFAKTLAFAAARPAKGVCSFDAMALAAPPGRTVACARDARRGAVYLAVYRTGGPEPEPVLPLRLAALPEVPALLPPGALVLGDALARFPDLLLGDGREAGPEALWDAEAAAVARLAALRFAREGGDEAHDLAPYYLRESEAEERLRGREEP